MSTDYSILDVTAENVDKLGFFCYMSKRKEPGFKQKREWLLSRFAEGMKIKILHEEGGRDTAFIEYIPGEYGWRVVEAKDYLLIHCLWVVGKGKGKGYGNHLIQICVEDARKQGKKGVAMVTTNRVWLAKKEIFEKNGFVEKDRALDTFQLMVLDFGNGGEARFPTNWEERARAFGEGLTVLRTPQCPYIENASSAVLAYAQEKGISARTVQFTSAAEVQAKSPSPYGVFGTVYNGRLFTYHYLQDNDYQRLEQEIQKIK